MGGFLQNIIVFCGARMGKADKYKKLASELATGLANKGKTIIYGGASSGLMGVIADEALAEDGKVIGFIPKNAMIEEVAHKGLSELTLTTDMHERKKKMYDVLFNAFGYYDPLIQMLDKMVAEGFMGEKDRLRYTTVSTLEEFWTFLGP